MDCPKCGCVKSWVGPHFRPAGRGYREMLRWNCYICGYPRYTPCKDAEGNK